MQQPITPEASKQQLLRAIQANFIEYFRPFQTLPNAIWHESAAGTWIVVHGAPGNHVLSVTLANDTDTQLDNLIADHRAATDFMRWLPTPIDTPSDLADRLAARGLRRNDDGEPVMIAPLAALPPQQPRSDLQIVRVRNEAQLRDWQRASGDGFGAGYAKAAVWGDAYLKKGLGPTNPFIHFVGYCDNRPVTSSSVLLAGGIAGVYDVSTAPAYRKRGLGRAITLACLHEASRQGAAVAYLRASHEGVGIYRALGFETLYHETECIWRAAPSTTGTL